MKNIFDSLEIAYDKHLPSKQTCSLVAYVFESRIKLPASVQREIKTLLDLSLYWSHVALSYNWSWGEEKGSSRFWRDLVESVRGNEQHKKYITRVFYYSTSCTLSSSAVSVSLRQLHMIVAVEIFFRDCIAMIAVSVPHD